MDKKLVRLFAGLGLLGLSGALQAGFITFADRVSWEAALAAAPASENFNSFVSDDEFGGSSTTAGVLTLSSNANASTEAEIAIPANFQTATGIDGTPMMRAAGLDVNELITITLPGAFSAFGFDFENFDAQGDALAVFIDGQNVISLPTTDNTFGFIGIIKDMGAFNSVELRNNGSDSIGTFNAFDNLAWGTVAVPEPTTLALMGLGLAGIGYRRKKAA